MPGKCPSQVTPAAFSECRYFTNSEKYGFSNSVARAFFHDSSIFTSIMIYLGCSAHKKAGCTADALSY